jgi:hypothetical protein
MSLKPPPRAVRAARERPPLGPPEMARVLPDLFALRVKNARRLVRVLRPW